ncbi:MAG: methyltransferase domain-containing protein [Desulfobaccales bacterium]
MSPEMTEAEIRQIRTGILEKYAKVAVEGAGCCFKYPTGKEGMTRQGYPLEILRDFPPEILAAFCGVGNPFGLGPLYPGDAILDIGCGAGVDSLVAAHLAGPGGRVVGIDVTFAMLQQARAHLARLGWPQVSFQVADAEALPFPDNDFDAVISNGVFNLTLNKAKALQEAHRVLKPGGRLMLADMVLVAALPSDRQDQVANWYQ